MHGLPGGGSSSARCTSLWAGDVSGPQWQHCKQLAAAACIGLTVGMLHVPMSPSTCGYCASMQRKPAPRRFEAPTKAVQKLCPCNSRTDIQASVAAHPTCFAMLLEDSTGTVLLGSRHMQLMPMHELQACKLSGLPGGTPSSDCEWMSWLPQVGELGAGRKGEIKLMKHIKSKELVAVKYIARVVSLPPDKQLYARGMLSILCCLRRLAKGSARTLNEKLSTTGSFCIPTSSGGLPNHVYSRLCLC